MRQLLVLGHSHIRALEAGLEILRGEDPSVRDRDIRFLQLARPELMPALTVDRDRNIVLTEPVLAELAKVDPSHVAACIAGNSFNALGLINHPRRFDYVSAEAPELGVDETVEVLPYDLVRGALETMLVAPTRMIGALARYFTVPIVHLEPPPPIPSEAHIRANPATFRDDVASLGVAPLALRQKLWRTQSAILRATCVELGTPFLLSPAKCQVPNEGLVEAAWAFDPTHANGWYGARVMRQLVQSTDAFRRADEVQA